MFQHGHHLQIHLGAAVIVRQVLGRVLIQILDQALMAVAVEILAAAEVVVIGNYILIF